MHTALMNPMECNSIEAIQTDTILTDRFEQALVYANQLHRAQRRKLPDVPYVCHLLGVAGD